MSNENINANEDQKPKFKIEEDTFEDFGFEQDDSESIYSDIYFVKLKSKDAAHFEFSKKVGDVIKIDKRTTINVLEGKLTKIEPDSFTFENKEVKTLKLNISKEVNGKNILFILNLTYTQTGRSILNSLIGLQKPVDKIYLELYRNKSGYTSVKVLLNGKKGSWLLSIDEQRKMIETFKNKKGEFVSNDYTELDDYLDNKMRNHLGILFPEMEQIPTVKFTDENEVEIDTKEPETLEEKGDDDDADAAGFFDLDNKED